MLVMSNLSYAELVQTLSQDQYNQLLQQYTAQVNETKKILDDPKVKFDAATQKQAFCTRLTAYQQIADMSKANITLESASIMLMAANSFLERQKQSFIDSGMTEQVFCALSKVEN
ncbi:hypothetical protein [Acinetobacter sp. ANC 4648]|uniref:hypothetical protein n=1 Tax=Acinetobacter sp. ANC 4648 TaxID=1977875 RepID=UPI000A35335C|nr:hypothetical protein [Acinetobacter sp. ANC 4648]